MIPWLDRREAKQRLNNIDKMIQQLGEEDAPAQILGQRDMIQYEYEYYNEQCDLWGKVVWGVLILIICVLSYNL
jgi:hypothetical protein